MSTKKEIVLVIQREDYNEYAVKTEHISLSGTKRELLVMNEGEYRFIEPLGFKRPECESNYDIIQMIPYIVLYATDDNTGENVFLTYKRGKKGAEGKLHEKYSVGVGGHIDITKEVDLRNKSDRYILGYHNSVRDIIVSELIKEVMEEVGVDLLKYYSKESLFDTLDKLKPFHLDEGPDSVNSYHFALPILVDANKFKHELKMNEPGIIENLSFKTIDELKELADEGALEAWTDIVLKNFIPPVVTVEDYKID